MAFYGIPIILKEGTKTESGNEALSQNTSAIRAISEAIKTTFGPRGLNKMLVDTIGDVTVTNDCYTILDEIEVEHPAAKMVIELSDSLNSNIGDGLTKALIMAGELLKIGVELLEQKIHPNIVTKGFNQALHKGMDIIDDQSQLIDGLDKDQLIDIAITALNSKTTFGAAKILAMIAVDCVLDIAEMRGDKKIIDLDLIQIIKKEGKQSTDTTKVNGVIVDKEIVNSTMPKSIKNAKIALINHSLEVTKTEFDTDIKIVDPSEVSSFKKQEENMLKKMVDTIVSSGANVIFCQKGIDDLAQHFLAKSGIMAIRRVKRSDLVKLSKATHANIIVDVNSINKNDLGAAEEVIERKIGKDKMVFVENCKNPNSISVLIRGGTRHVIEDAERSFKNSLNVVKQAVEHKKIVTGAGAIEVEVAKQLRRFAANISTKESIAVEAYAAALEAIPSTLAENAGLDPIKILTDLHAKHEKSLYKDYGIDIENGDIFNAKEAKIIEPAIILKSALSAATELCLMIFRVDQVIEVEPGSTGPKMPGSEDEDFD
ncbi:MAG: thermosome subunit [Candidatus Lokiarchaeota archaeon]|nr:thermosome subunit [Candidatus Lokiarchaeota archaeon]